MKSIIVKDLFDFESEVEDCWTIVRAFGEAGYDICLEQAQIMWATFSSDRESGWYPLPYSKERILEYLKDYYEVVDES